MTNDNKHDRPDLLVETDWLAEHLDDPNVRIVDMGPIDAYKTGPHPRLDGSEPRLLQGPGQ